MALTTMTAEWKTVADDITVYIIRKKRHDEASVVALAKDPVRLFNEWAQARGYAVQSAELAMWCVDYLQDLVKTPLPRLIKAAEIDGLHI